MNSTNRQFTCPMQAFDLIHTSSHIIKNIIKALLFNYMSGGVQDEYRVRSHVVMNLRGNNVGKLEDV